MREIAFIKQNKEKWLEYEHIIVNKVQKDPDILADIYLKLTNDLSFAQTYYPKSKVTNYLNYLTSIMFQRVYKTKRNNFSEFLDFFKTDVPLLAYQYRKYLYAAFILYFIFLGIGILSAIYNDEFSRFILGHSYVEETLNNIKKGNPMAIYKSMPEEFMTFYITINNLIVGSKMYFYGIFGGFGTMYILLSNSIMVGTFQTFFYQHDVFMESVRGIWLHGSMEIFGMIIEAGAGFILAASFLFPKTYSRLVSFKIGFKNSFKIYLSTIPFTFFAGFIEGYVTRWAKEMPNFVNYLIIIATLGFISFYYLIYPVLLAKSYKLLEKK
nr:stage II sporulation protein M [uncultured Flavobacterium sp.]